MIKKVKRKVTKRKRNNKNQSLNQRLNSIKDKINLNQRIKKKEILAKAVIHLYNK